MTEVKSIPQFTTKIADRDVTGVYSVFGNVDFTHDVGQPGSFTKTLQERKSKILHLWSHQTHEPATAVIRTIAEVGRNDLPDDAKAMYPEATGGAIVTREYLNTPRANEIFENIKAGVPLQMSYGYDAVKVAFEQRDGVRVRLLVEQKLFETSDCTFGANPASSAAKTLAIPSAAKLRRALQQIKAMDGMELATEAYDIYGASAALSSIGMLLEGEGDDPQALAQLIGAMRLLLAFIGGEIDGIETGAITGAVADMGMQTASRVFAAGTLLLKAGARNAQTDQRMINDLHDMSINLGANNCAGTTSGDKSRADPPVGASLTLLKHKLAFLDFATQE